MCFIILSCLLVIFHSIDYLDLSVNSLTGTILSQIGLLTKLSESSIVRLPVVMIVVMFFSVYSHACLFILQIPWLSPALV
jgi:hypothetical protein